MKTPEVARPYGAYRDAVVPPSSRKKTRPARVRLTHLEVRRGDALRLRIAIADDVMAELGDDLGALIKKIAPSTQTSVVKTPPLQADVQPEILVSRQHADHDDDYHAGLREHLVELFSSFCDTALAAALEIAREERDRRAEGGN